MPRPFAQIDSVQTDEGLLELRRRGDSDFMILIAGRVLMTSTITTSELALAKLGCARIKDSVRPRVLIGGLGLGFTLRAALDTLPQEAEVIVAELNDKVVEWCLGPAGGVTQGAARDPRVSIFRGDVTAAVSTVADQSDQPRLDAILWDLYVGPTRTGGERDPLYGDKSVKATAKALRPGGVFGVWGETPSPAFEQRLRRSGLLPELVRTGGGGLRHAVYLATKSALRGTQKKA